MAIVLIKVEKPAIYDFGIHITQPVAPQPIEQAARFVGNKTVLNFFIVFHFLLASFEENANSKNGEGHTIEA